jgi:hypothetical protein
MLLVSKRHPQKPTAGLAELLDRPDEEFSEDDLPDGLYMRANGAIEAKCRSCDNTYEADWLTPSNLKDWDPDYSYCGGSDRCIP